MMLLCVFQIFIWHFGSKRILLIMQIYKIFVYRSSLKSIISFYFLNNAPVIRR